jgi:hypothetical protein
MPTFQGHPCPQLFAKRHQTFIGKKDVCKGLNARRGEREREIHTCFYQKMNQMIVRMECNREIHEFSSLNTIALLFHLKFHFYLYLLFFSTSLLPLYALTLSLLPLSLSFSKSSVFPIEIFFTSLSLMLAPFRSSISATSPFPK